MWRNLVSPWLVPHRYKGGNPHHSERTPGPEHPAQPGSGSSSPAKRGFGQRGLLPRTPLPSAVGSKRKRRARSLSPPPYVLPRVRRNLGLNVGRGARSVSPAKRGKDGGGGLGGLVLPWEDTSHTHTHSGGDAHGAMSLPYNAPVAYGEGLLLGGGGGGGGGKINEAGDTGMAVAKSTGQPMPQADRVLSELPDHADLVDLSGLNIVSVPNDVMRFQTVQVVPGALAPCTARGHHCWGAKRPSQTRARTCTRTHMHTP